ncbi:MAG: transposase [Chloroflexia bacterium]|jgi:REP element-mobilizing transposase RayT|nr:transposase [Chloroflexia bacterium]
MARYDPNHHHRRSVRLRGHDYSDAGLYFVTICTARREPVLGKVRDDRVCLSDLGNLIAAEWMALPGRFPTIALDACVVMPDHLHGIIMLGAVPLDERNQGPSASSPTLGQVIGVFKSVSGIAANRVSGRSGASFWQRDYYERIIRDDAMLDHARRYIETNPARWAADDRPRPTP